MSGIRSWARRYWLEIAWALFALANLVALVLIDAWETVPFHFVWVSMTVLYGYRVWRLRTTLLLLGALCVASTAALGWVVVRGPQGVDELTEVPLMAAMFLAMVWQARRRQTALVELRRAAEREREFIRDASHQLKTPIAGAHGLVQMMRGSVGVEPSQEDLADLSEQLVRLTTVAENLLLLQTALQPDSLVRAEVEIEDVVVAAARRWSLTAVRDWRVTIETEGIVFADRQRLDTALDAIVDNAVRATRETDMITIGARAHGDEVIVDVIDSGVGIPVDAQARVFDRFWSAGAHGGDKRGTGLGLSIVKAIAEAHGGTAYVCSVPGCETTVSLKLARLSASRSPTPEDRKAFALRD